MAETAGAPGGNPDAPNHMTPSEGTHHMDPKLNDQANNLAQLTNTKWSAAMGLIGCLLLAGILLAGTPYDPQIAGGIAVSMIGIGFGEAECRQIVDQPRRGNGMTWTYRQVRWFPRPLGLAFYALGIAAFAFTLNRSWPALFS